MTDEEVNKAKGEAIRQELSDSEDDNFGRGQIIESIAVAITVEEPAPTKKIQAKRLPEPN